MSVSTSQSRVRQLTSTLDRARRKQADLESRAAKAEGDVAKALRDAERAGSQSSRASKLRRADSKRRDAAKARQGAAAASKNVSDTQRKLHEAESKLADAEASQRRQEQSRARRADKRREREDRRTEAERRREISSLDARATDLEDQVRAAQRQLAPPEITVLFLASSPEDLAPLRLDKETREIQKRLRETEYRDSIKVEWKLARQLGDLIQDLNETRPHRLLA